VLPLHVVHATDFNLDPA